MSKYYIKLPRKEDIEEMLEIESYSHERPWDQKAFEIELSKFFSGKTVFFVAKDEETDKLVGYIMGDLIVDYIHISNVSVDRDYRKQGIGAELLRKLELETKKRDYRKSTLEVRENNEAAVILYRRHGYEIKGKREKYYNNEHDALLMWKVL